MSIKVIELLVDEELSGQTRVEEIALVLQPAIETEILYFNQQGVGNVTRTTETTQESFQNSFSDYPEGVKTNARNVLKWVEKNGWGSCGTPVGKQRANQLAKGEPISFDTVQRMFSYLSRHKQDLESSKSYSDGCGKLMFDSWGGMEGLRWSQMKLRQVKQEMDYDVSSLTPWSQTTGTTENFVEPCWDGYIMVGYKEKDGRRVPNCVPEREGLSVDAPGCGCGCWNDGVEPDDIVGTYFGETMINGMPVFENEEDALSYAENIGCEGSHKHVIDGKEYYMPCETHPQQMCGCGYNDTSVEQIQYFGEIDMDFIQDYDEEDFEVMRLMKFLKETDYEKFESVVVGMNGRTEQEIYRRNHRTPKIYFKYERVILEGQPDRDFCISIEGRYFTRPEIDLLKDINRDFGHKRQPYSKWLYKGGPNCVHAWRKFLFQGKDKVDQGMAQGTAGIPPKRMENNGYFDKDTKKASERAYAISQSQQNMTRQEFKVDGEKRMVYSPAMKPGILIPRVDDVSGERYFVTFSPETIERMSQRYMIDKRSGGGYTNLEHTEKKFEDVYLVESWIVDGDQDKAYSLGYTKQQVPPKTWMVGFRVDSDEVWNMIKQGKIKGISIEGNFEYSFNKQDFQEKDVSSSKGEEYLLTEIINIINQIK